MKRRVRQNVKNEMQDGMKYNIKRSRKELSRRWLALMLCMVVVMSAGCGNSDVPGNESVELVQDGGQAQGGEQAQNEEQMQEQGGEQEQDAGQVQNGGQAQGDEQTQNGGQAQGDEQTQNGEQMQEQDGGQMQGEEQTQNEEQMQEQGGEQEQDAGQVQNGKQEPNNEQAQIEQQQAAQQKQAEWEALKTAFTDTEVTTVYTTANVNVRMAPSTEAEVWQLVKRGTVFEKNGESEGWSRVVAEGNEYYIKSDYLREKRQPGEGGHMVAIDAGHQRKGNGEKEAIGPGATEMKAKVTGGTRGITTGLYEYELNLMVAEKLKEELESRGYIVYMVRESHDVNISNSERAQMAYESGAEILVRIHANGAENSSANGAMTICPTAQNPYISHLYSDSQRLSSLVLDGLTTATGCRKERVWETDTMSGINWSQIPVTIVEMGYMTNPQEDQNLAREDYQRQIAAGIADGIDWYFSD